MNRSFFLAIILLAGTIVGAGMFSLPYVFSRLGILCGFFYLFFFTIVYFLIHWMYAGIIRTQSGNHQFFYFARTYLNKNLADFAGWIILMELIFVLAVYLILAPTFIKLLWPQIGFGGFFIFWAIGSIFVFSNLRWLGLAEAVGALAILAIVFFVFFGSLNQPLEIPLVKPLTLSLFFLPFGPLLFSLAGRPAISKLVATLQDSPPASQPSLIKNAIFWGTAIPALIYGIFTVGVLRFNPQASPDAVSGLGFLNASFLDAFALAGLLAILTSFLVVAVNVKEILNLDLKRGKFLSAVIAIFAPLGLYFLGLKDFLPILSFTGGVFLALEAIFVVMMWRHAFPKHHFKWLSWPLYVIFLLAIVYQFVSLVL